MVRVDRAGRKRSGEREGKWKRVRNRVGVVTKEVMWKCRFGKRDVMGLSGNLDPSDERIGV